LVVEAALVVEVEDVVALRPDLVEDFAAGITAAVARALPEAGAGPEARLPGVVDLDLPASFDAVLVEVCPERSLPATLDPTFDTSFTDLAVNLLAAGFLAAEIATAPFVSGLSDTLLAGLAADLDTGCALPFAGALEALVAPARGTCRAIVPSAFFAIAFGFELAGSASGFTLFPALFVIFSSFLCCRGAKVYTNTFSHDTM
jgi:hypothetical protein